MPQILDCFVILIRKCRRLDPGGYELTLELRPKPAADASTVRTQAPEEGGPRPRGKQEALHGAS
jgi:hypothetical protein